jgi:uncharacterized protein (DUF3084 family)
MSNSDIIAALEQLKKENLELLKRTEKAEAEARDIRANSQQGWFSRMFSSTKIKRSNWSYHRG